MRSRVPKSFVKLIGGLSAFLATIVFLLISAVALVLYTEAGSAFVSKKVLEWYNGTIPGNIELENVSGKLGSEFRVHHVVAVDRTGAPLANIGSVFVEWSPAKLLRGTVQVRKLEVGGVQIHLYPESNEGPFADIAPQGDPEQAAETRPESGDALVSLPVRLEANFWISDFSLSEHTAKQNRSLVKSASLSGQTRGDGDQLDVQIDRLVGSSPEFDVELKSFVFQGLLKGNTARIDKLDLKSNLGELNTSGTDLDLSEREGRTHFQARIPRLAVSRFSQVDFPSDIQLRGDIRGGLDSFQSQMTLSAAEGGRLNLTVDGEARDKIDVKAVVQVVEIDPKTYSKVESGAIAGTGEISIQGTDFRSAEIKGFFRCESCRIWPLNQLDADIDFRLKEGAGGGHGKLSGAGLFLEAETTMSNWRPTDLSFRIRGNDLARTRRVFSKVRDLPELSGSFSASGTCYDRAGQVRCRGQVKGKNLAAFDVQVATADLSFSGLPFDENLPFSGTIDTQGVSFQETVVQEMTVNARGNLSRIRLTLSGRLNGDSVLKTDLTWSKKKYQKLRIHRLKGAYKNISASLNRPAAITLGSRFVDIDDFSLQVDSGTVTLDGRFSRDSSSNLRLAVRKFPLEMLTKTFPEIILGGLVDANAQLTGSARAPELTLNLAGKKLRYRQVAVGNVEVTSDFRRNVLKGELKLRGELVEELEATFSTGLPYNFRRQKATSYKNKSVEVVLRGRGLHLEQIASLIPNLAVVGSADFDVTLSGQAQNPDLKTAITLSDMGWQDIRADRGEITLAYHHDIAEIHLNVTGNTISELDCTGKIPLRIDFPEKIAWQKDAEHQVDINIRGADLEQLSNQLAAHSSQKKSRPLDLSGKANLTGRLRGTPAAPFVDIVTSFDNVHFEKEPIGKGTIKVGFEDDNARFHAVIAQNSGAKAELRASIPVSINLEGQGAEWLSQREHHLSLSINGVSKSLLAPLIDFPEKTDFRLEGKIDGSGSREQFSLSGNWRGVLLQPGIVSLPVRGSLLATQEGQKSRLEVGSPNTPMARATVSTQIPHEQLANGSFSLATVPLRARIEIPRFDVEPFATFMPGSLHKARGHLKGQIDVAGTLGKPTVTGRVVFSDGEITVVDFNQRVKEIGFMANISGHSLTIENLHFKSGPGKGAGSFRLKSTPDGSLLGTGKLTLKEFPFVRPGIPEGRINAEIQAKIDHLPNRTDIDVALHDPFIRLLERSVSRVPKTIPEDENIVFVEDVVPAGDTAPARGHQNETTRTTSISLDLSDPIEIVGPGLDMRWAGKVSIDSRPEQSRITGGIRSFPGRFRLLRNTFEIESGQVTLPSRGVLDPYVSVTATTNTAEADVIVTVRGRLSRPELTLSSNPAMSQYKIVSLLVAGRSDTSETSNEDVGAQAASLLLWFQNPNLERQIYSRLGIDRVGLSLGSSVKTPVLTVGKRIGRKLYVETEYQHNAPSDENRVGARVEYRLRPDWSLETSYGDAQKGEVGVFWRKQFDSKQRVKDGQKPPSKPAPAKAKPKKK